MSIRLEVAYQDLLKRVANLEAIVASMVPVSEPEQPAEPSGQAFPKHMHFGKWGLVDENGNWIDKGPYSKEAAQKAAELAA